MKRLFFAVLLDENIRGKVSSLQQKLRSQVQGVRWVNPENLHMTLRFLGEVNEQVIPRLVDVSTQVASITNPFTLEFNGLGSFPRRQPKVIWLGAGRGSGPLKGLSEKLDAGLASVFEGERDNSFTPHLTLGRVKHRGNQHWADVRREYGNFKVGEMKVESFCLIESKLTLQGPVYTQLKRFPLGKGAIKGGIEGGEG